MAKALSCCQSAESGKKVGKVGSLVGSQILWCLTSVWEVNGTQAGTANIERSNPSLS
ncbi:hypothetical protein [Leptothoe spongobia]|uniref:hypothetical protein n=1 Tax=Leptothoe spongobia TaxID=2651728 RepID=UPI001C0310CB|nr:hypothetical protein [Leptothoe spongobia]